MEMASAVYTNEASEVKPQSKTVEAKVVFGQSVFSEKRSSSSQTTEITSENRIGRSRKYSPEEAALRRKQILRKPRTPRYRVASSPLRSRASREPSSLSSIPSIRV